jgi:hypothetical protein
MRPHACAELVARNRELCELCAAVRAASTEVRDQSTALASDAANMREFWVVARADCRERFRKIAAERDRRLLSGSLTRTCSYAWLTASNQGIG